MTDKKKRIMEIMTPTLKRTQQKNNDYIGNEG